MYISSLLRDFFSLPDTGDPIRVSFAVESTPLDWTMGAFLHAAVAAAARPHGPWTDLSPTGGRAGGAGGGRVQHGTADAALLGWGTAGCQHDAGEHPGLGAWCAWGAGGAAFVAVALVLVGCCVCLRRARCATPSPVHAASWIPTGDVALPEASQRRITDREPPQVRSKIGGAQRLSTAASYYHAVRFEDDAEVDDSELTFI